MYTVAFHVTNQLVMNEKEGKTSLTMDYRSASGNLPEQI
jgi:hypothetical protein